MRSKTVISLLFGIIGGSYVLLHDIFIIFFIDAYVNGFGITIQSFLIGEFIFLIWNSLNDLIFGFYIDAYILKNSKSSSKIITKRLSIIRYSSLLFSIIFSLMWKNIYLSDYPGIRFGLNLCIYDTFLTLINQQHDALLNDLSSDQIIRMKLGQSTSFFQAISAFGVIFVSWKSHQPHVKIGSNQNLSEDFTYQVDVLSLFCGLISVISSSILIKFYSHNRIDTLSTTPQTHEGGKAIFKYFSSLFNLKNMFWLVLTQIFQIFNCHFNSNFFPIIAQSLLSEEWHEYIFLILGVSFILPHINNYFLLKISEKFGIYSVIRYLFLIKVLIALFTFLFGYNSSFIIIFFILSNRIFTEGVCKIFSQVITYLVDEDYITNLRQAPIPTIVLGTTSFFSKPGQTLAPIVGILSISSLMGKNFCPDGDCSKAIFDVMTDKFQVSADSPKDTLKRACFLTSTILTIIAGSLQLLFWNKFTLHGDYLKRLQAQCQKRLTSSPTMSKFNLV